MSTCKIFAEGREWLNPLGHDDTGAIAWVVEAVKYNVDSVDYVDGKPRPGHVTSSVTIRDCARQIELDFGVGYPEEPFEQRIEKLDELIRVFTEVRAGLVDAWEFVNSAPETSEEP